MNDNDGVSRTTLVILLVLLVCGITTYVAYLHPAFGVALVIGLAAAALVWQITNQD